MRGAGKICSILNARVLSALDVSREIGASEWTAATAVLNFDSARPVDLR